MTNIDGRMHAERDPIQPRRTNERDWKLEDAPESAGPPTPPPEPATVQCVTPHHNFADRAEWHEQNDHEGPTRCMTTPIERFGQDSSIDEAVPARNYSTALGVKEKSTQIPGRVKTYKPYGTVKGEHRYLARSTGRDSQDKVDGGAQQSASNQHKRKQSQVDSLSHPQEEKEKILKLSPERIQELVYSPESINLQSIPSKNTEDAADTNLEMVATQARLGSKDASIVVGKFACKDRAMEFVVDDKSGSHESLTVAQQTPMENLSRKVPIILRPAFPARALSNPTINKASQSAGEPILPSGLHSIDNKERPTSTRSEQSSALRSPARIQSLSSPAPPSLPLPPLSIPTYLQLELSSHRPSQLYIHRSATSDFPYESSRVKVERLLNFLLLPPQLESVLWFGALACLDAWLYTFTILPLRLLKSVYLLSQSWSINIAAEVRYVSTFVYKGTGRMWRRRRTRGVSEPRPTDLEPTGSESMNGPQSRERSSRVPTHRRSKTVPSLLLPDDKADILKGLLIIFTCLILLRLDASRMYHWIRGQAAIKLYVIYNVLEVCDRLFSAIGQDVLECLFSRESLERKPDGHSKILRPLGLFALALVYTSTHATALFYQVITLNVAVNSYSNALITLLMSNQFVEIKSTVFKKFEKENLFQLTCADVVERFQLWLMLTIIASRNIIETGGLSMGLSTLASSSGTMPGMLGTNNSHPVTQVNPSQSSSSILPRSFTLVPALLSSLTAYAPGVAQVLGPFLVVLGSEMFVDWLKHAYINKFNNTRPAIYGRFLDVLAKDYYSNAFSDQNLTKRLGLPVLPLSCLFIRASVQTYQMFQAAWMPSSITDSSTSLASIHEQYTASRASMPMSMSTFTALSHKLADLLRQIVAIFSTSGVFSNVTTILIFLLIFLVLLACKIVLGMLLLSFARSRYRSIKERERNPIHHVEGGKRVGGWGVVEVDDDKRRWIYDGDNAGLKTLQDREERDKAKRERGVSDGFDKVQRYEMAAKRIW